MTTSQLTRIGVIFMSKVLPTTSKRIRVKIQVKLFKGPRVANSTTMWKKSQVRLWVQRVPAAEWTSGYIKVIYSDKFGYYNHAYFQNYKRFDRLLTEMTEWELVKDFIQSEALE